MRRGMFSLVFLVSMLSIAGNVVIADSNEVDATSMRGKVLCGYQGWFRCPDDGAGFGWIHWSWNSEAITPETLTFEMWPDMRDYSQDEKYEAPGFTYPNGEEAHLYSAHNTRTVLRHFEWMQEYGIDGAWLQRFLVGLPGGPIEEHYLSTLQVLYNVQNAASQTGRVWALAYDMAAMPTDDIFQVMTSDWKNLVDWGITDDPRYLHHNGKPVLVLWAFHIVHRPNVTATVANQVIDFFKNDPNYSAFLVGGCQWTWRSVEDEDWATIFRSFDVICPWNVGNCIIEDGRKWANTNYWQEDIEEAENVGMLYLPVVYPGFSWDNLLDLPPGTSLIPRQGGKFYWKQFYRAAQLGLDMVYVAMFDEVDEGTAIFKVTNQPPQEAYFVTYEDFPSDWYLRLTAEGTKMLQGECQITPEIPIGYTNPDGTIENLNSGTRYDYIQYAITDANHGDVIVVQPGDYLENFYLQGKNVIVRSTDPNNPAVAAATVIWGDGSGPVVTFCAGEREWCVLAGFTITDGKKGIYCKGASPTIRNCNIAGNKNAGIESWYVPGWRESATIISCTIADNEGAGVMARGRLSPTIVNCIVAGNRKAGIDGDESQIVTNCTVANNGAWGISGYGTITNCIVWGNSPPEIEDYGSATVVTHSNVRGGYSGLGNIDVDPCFADPNNDDYHLKSQAGRWDANSQSWVLDGMTSRCIDAGSPGCHMGDEPNDANNLRINMGAYSGTAEASMPPYDWVLLADLTNDGTVDFVDLAHLVEYWLISNTEQPGDLDRDGIVGTLDFALVGQDWSLETSWHE